MTLGECLVEGSTGTLELTGNGSVTHRHKGRTEKKVILQAQEWPGFAGDCVLALQKHVIDAVQSNGPLENLAEDYLTVLETEKAIYLSSEQQARVEL